MKTQIKDLAKCSCGALSVFLVNGSDVCMTPETFKKVFKGEEMKPTLNDFSNCNHCVNNWGIDLCGCGSGEKVGECTNDFSACRKKEAAQTIGEIKVYKLWG